MTLIRTRETVYALRAGVIDTSNVDLTNPVSGVTTQEDANQVFHQRIEALEAGGGGGGPITEIDCGTY